MTLQNVLYLLITPKGKNEDLLLFMVPKVHQTAALNRCHRDKDTKAMTIPCPYYKNCFGGLEWSNR